MTGMDRKAAVAAYKERKIVAGIYAVRCGPTGQVWVGSAPDLSTIENRLWFTLRQGRNTHRSLQEAWTAQGSEAFTFEIVAKLADEDDPVYARSVALRNLHADWVERLKGLRI